MLMDMKNGLQTKLVKKHYMIPKLLLSINNK